MRLPALRSRLLVLAFGSTVPLLVLSLLLAGWLLRREEALVRDGAMDRSRAIASAVDARLDGQLALLRALSVDEHLAAGDLARFLAVARRVREVQPFWRNLLLVDRSGQHRVNLRFDADASNLPHEAAGEMASLHQVLDTGLPHVGDVGRGPFSGLPGVALQFRTSVAGEAMVLKLVLDPKVFASLIEAQRVPAAWSVSLVDGHGRFVAGGRQQRAGEPVPAGEALAPGRRSGWAAVVTPEGMPVHQAFSAPSLAGWTVVVAMPSAEVRAGTRDVTRWLLGGMLVSVLLAGTLALWMSRRIAGPMRALAQAAGGLGAGSAAPLAAVAAQPGSREARDVAVALQDAAQALHEREALKERERVALREAGRAKDEFLAMLGHELRNPLGAIAASAHLLRLAPAGDAAQRAHQVIDRQTRHMTRLVEDLMDMSRVVAGKLVLDCQPLDLWPVVEHAVDTWRQLGRNATAPLRLEGASVWVEADRARVEQIVMNLLDNAFKFGPPGSPIAVVLQTDAGWATLSVRDAGRGIAAIDLPRVFDTFFQVAQPLHRPHGGLGLGLALVKRLAELQRGDIVADSAGEGQGATFTVRLPSVLQPAPG
jgi:signal transduction histidine kinase